MCNSNHTDYYTRSGSTKEVHSSLTAYEPTKVEHIANMITHAIWILPSLLGFYKMLQLSDSLKKFLVISLYGTCLVSLFSVSTIFHFLAYAKQKNCFLKNAFHLGDRAVIYLFIAASYTPWLMLRDFHGNAVNFVVAAVWLAALLGIVYQCRFHERFKWLEIVFYVSLGVLPALVTVDIRDSSGLFDVAYGGAIYVLGIFFFKADGILPCAHAVWHCFVSAGALVHYKAICHHLLI